MFNLSVPSELLITVVSPIISVSPSILVAPVIVVSPIISVLFLIVVVVVEISKAFILSSLAPSAEPLPISNKVSSLLSL